MAQYRRKPHEEKFFQAIADAAPIMIWVADVTALCTYFNRPWLDFRGRSMNEEMGNGWTEGLHPEDAELTITTYRSCFQERKPFKMEYRLLRHDGQYRWIVDSGSPVFDDGSFIGYIGSCIDISEVKESELKLRKALKEKGELINEMHHRVKNNLQIVASLLSLQMYHSPSPDSLPALREAVNRIISMSFVHEDDLRADQIRVNLNKYFGRIVNHLQQTHPLESKNVGIRTDIPLQYVKSSPAVLLGLILNELLSTILRLAWERQCRLHVNIKWQRKSAPHLLFEIGGQDRLNKNDLYRVSAVGMEMVKLLAMQLQGNLELKTSTKSFQLSISLPKGIVTNEQSSNRKRVRNSERKNKHQKDPDRRR